MSVYAGIDIAARSFDVVLRKQGQNQKVMSFDQSPKGHSAVIELLKNHPVERIVMEATGVYYLDLAVALHQAGLPVCVINPKSFRRSHSRPAATRRRSRWKIRTWTDRAHRCPPSG